MHHKFIFAKFVQNYDFEYIRSEFLVEIEPSLGLGAFLVERSFFPENERNDQERPHRSEKKTNA